MYIPSWATQALALLSALSPVTRAPQRTWHLLGQDGDGKTCYLAVDKIERGAKAKLAVVDGDAPPADDGVWAVQPVSGAWLWKLFVPDTNLCLRSHLATESGRIRTVELAECDATLPGAADTWELDWLDDTRTHASFILLDDTRFRLSFKDHTVGAVRHVKGWEKDFEVRKAAWGDLESEGA
ncbi:hypothetical protein CC85DRAFT_328312 [Cutaneotrichosporon oleaginosum]|uniref:Ricin B lectin domain-containing protein n=1 Tax=Cutaneotrichosporon oleaginosum TaxID=879819 RepID=A0A0J0XM88_9TREE|nr:uncharacterized protein CC85DRAFT_328312 [Cutaneotrichosporon oleaginosum]KLT42245.1 hypothetical protein CC85DRAFT_328312 [Cutaneotrichosporon oleaginosum]TXT11418.1 hypothetical protein COLE_01828 [Cutaneotrichosporon oleaginosum]